MPVTFYHQTLQNHRLQLRPYLINHYVHVC